ncbi:hypothetical protein FSP39_024010, partial [Pinctada imbricata]
GATVCSPTNRVTDPSRCLNEIKALSESTSQFWFGTAYKTRCSGSKAGTMECSNYRSYVADSIVSRLGISSNLEIFVDIKYHSNAGTYRSCGNQYTVSPSVNISLDPTSTEQITPWEARMAPTISWEPHNGTYTVVILSVGVPINHGIYINIPGNRFADAEVIKAYNGPIHFFTSFAQVYAFLVFKQQDDNLVIPSDWTARLSTPGFMQYNIPSMMTALNLSGPVGMSWMSVIGDPYAVQSFINSGSFDMCTYLIQNGIKTHNRTFVPADPTLDVNLDVTFSPPALTFTSCCNQFSYPSRTFKLNPLGDLQVKTADVRTSVLPTVELTIGGSFFHKIQFYRFLFNISGFVADSHLTLTGATWFITTQDEYVRHNYVTYRGRNQDDVCNGVQGYSNPCPTSKATINYTRWTSGDVVIDYTGPMPPDNNPHYYYFLLYEQQGELDISNFRNYTDPPGSRLLFNISDFVMDNNLTLVGATWFIATNDEYARNYYATSGGQSEETVCNGVPGYGDPCPVSKATPVIATWCILLVTICMIKWSDIQ